MKKVFLPLMAAALLISCNNQNNEVVPTGDEIMLSSAQKLITKAPYLNEETTPGEGEDAILALVPICETAENYLTIYDNAIGEKGGQFMYFDKATSVGFCTADKVHKAKYYPRGDQNQPLRMFGLYPVKLTAETAEGADQFWNLTETGATATITGCEDVMVAPEVTTSKQKVNAGGASPAFETLAFAHKLTRLDVKVAAYSEEAVTSWESITKIELVGTGASNAKPKNGISVTAKDGATSFTGETESLTFFSWTDAGYTDVAADGTSMDLGTLIKDYQKKGSALDMAKCYRAAYLLCEAVEADGTGDNHEYQIKVTTKNDAGEDKTYEIDLMQDNNTDKFTGSTAGYAFTINLVFDVDEIMATATVTPWKGGGDVTIEIE